MATIKGHKNLPYLYPMEAFQSVSMQFRRFPFPWVLHSPFLFSWRLEHVEFFYVSPWPCARLQCVLCLHCLGFNDVTPAIPRISCLVPVLNVRGHSIWRHVTCRFVQFTYLRSKVLCGIQIVWEHLCCRRKSCAEIWSWWEYRAR